MRDQCPNCGAELDPGARVCPECGSDETTGWSQDAKDSELGLPDESFDYDQFVNREFGDRRAKAPGIRWFWWLVAVMVLAGIVWFSIR